MLAPWIIALLCVLALLILVVLLGFIWPIWYTVGKKEDDDHDKLKTTSAPFYRVEIRNKENVSKNVQVLTWD